MKPKLKWAAVAVGCAAIAAAAFVGGRAWAGGIPAAGALTYSGLLQDATGAPLSGPQYVEVKFWNDVAASAAANLLCDTGTPGLAQLNNGRFSIPLLDKCTTQVGSNTAIWAEVFVGPTVNAAASLGRAKIGAVPFAVEANHATTADGATAGAELDTRIGAIEAASPIKSMFRARQTQAQSFPSGQPTTTIKFDVEDFDFGNEFNPATSTFQVKATGYYQVSCNTEWNITSLGQPSAYFEVEIYVNGTRQSFAGFVSDGYYTTRHVSSLLKLAANDMVTCHAFQSTGGAQSLALNVDQQNTFEAVRLAQ
jgi:hypothetical protein